MNRPSKAAAAVVIGVVTLLLFTTLAPLVNTGFSVVTQVLAFAFAVLATGSLLFGFALLIGGVSTPRLLALGAVCAVLGGLAAIPARPEILADGPSPIPLLAHFLSNTLRILAAAALGLALARHVTSPTVALLIAAVATATDLFSVFAGPTKAMVEQGAPALNFLLVIFPTFGQPLGFALGISDFIFLSLFIAVGLLLNLRHTATTVAVCAGTLLAMTTSLFLERPLPALPFISLSFVAVNADLILAAFAKCR